MAGKKFPAVISLLFVQNLFMRLLPDGDRMVGQYVRVEQAPLFQNRDYRVFDRLKGDVRRPVRGGYSAWKRPAFSGSSQASVR
jgi:hypothetical protein